MLLFVFVITVSAVFYLYYKTKQFRSHLPVRKNWYKSKAGVALGLFLLAFGVNLLFLDPSAVSYVIAAVFIILGVMMAYTNYQAALYHSKFLEEERRINP
ncbi:YtpI family protein [Indiicoccus explosivorum]|uniref:YtpI family protein n=1 Tax=Indiicoccus explosivorum TaxID=1917864 RepID=UPI000B42DA34|nr:YtpI family protein [Indiicoccus explosivorum]